MSVTVDTSQFQAALRKHLATTSRDLQWAITSRLAFVVMRAMKHLKPHSISGKRDEVRSYLFQVLESRGKLFTRGKRKGQVNTAKDHIIAHRIVQSNASKGYYGREMTKATKEFTSRTIKSVGYMKAAMAHALTKLVGTVTIQVQGKKERIVSKSFASLRSEFSPVGPATSSVSTISKGSGWNPFSSVNVELTKVRNGQESKVNSLYVSAVNRAFAEETEEMIRHMEAKVLDNAEKAGFIVP